MNCQTCVDPGEGTSRETKFYANTILYIRSVLCVGFCRAYDRHHQKREVLPELSSIKRNSKHNNVNTYCNCL